MANSQAQFSPPPYNNSHPTSPMSQMGSFPPPNKRPRLSPNAQSPYVSPQMTNGSLPNSGFNSPYYGPQTNGMPMAAPSPAPPTPTTGVMGPPLRPPEEKPADLNDLSDVLHSAGVNIRDEEAFLSSHAYTPQAEIPFSQSFNFPGSAGVQLGYFDHATYSTLSHNQPGDRDSFYGAGAFNQPVVSAQVLEDRADLARKENIRRQCYIKQYELNDPFLSTRGIWRKLQPAMRSQHVQLSDGPYSLPAEQYQRDIRTLGPPGGEQLARVQDKMAVKSSGIGSDVLTLLSLAAKDRLRALIEDAGSLAKGRRSTAHGIVPPDLRDIAAGRGEPFSALFETSLNQQSLKRSFSESNNDLPTPVSESHPPPLETIAYPNILAQTLTKATRAERALEDARAQKRNKRSASGISSTEQSRSASISGTAGPGTPGTLGEQAPDVQAPKKGLTKKEQKRQADAKASEAQQHAATNSSLSMALGTRGNLFGGKKISWMTSKQSAGDAGFVPPSKLNTASQKGSGGAAGGSGSGAGRTSSAPAVKGIGDFREDKEGGRGIQMRDIVSILEPDLREKKALARAYNRLSSKS